MIYGILGWSQAVPIWVGKHKQMMRSCQSIEVKLNSAPTPPQPTGSSYYHSAALPLSPSLRDLYCHRQSTSHIPYLKHVTHPRRIHRSLPRRLGGQRALALPAKPRVEVQDCCGMQLLSGERTEGGAGVGARRGCQDVWGSTG